MVTLIFSPRWFYGIDSLFDIVFVLVSILIAAFARKAFRLTRERKFLSLYWAFVFFALAFLVKILTHVVIYFKYMDLNVLNLFLALGEITLGFQIGYFLYRLVFLLSLIILLSLTMHITDKRILVMLQIFAVLFAATSMAWPVVFHIVGAVFLFFICNTCRMNYKFRGTMPSKLVAYSFLMFFLSQVMFILMSWHDFAYVLGETMQLIGSLLLLASLYLVLR